MNYNTEETRSAASELADFDKNSGSFFERLLFNNRPSILLLCLIATILLGFQATRVKLNADFNKMIPTQQPYIANFLAHYQDLQSAGNAIRIVVEANSGTVINAHYLEVLQKINDEVYLLPNVDRAYMTSLWTPSTRWIQVTNNGIETGPVIDQNYDGSPGQLSVVAGNIAKTGRIGDLVSNDFSSSMIYVPLLETDGLTGKPVDYGRLTNQLNDIRARYSRQGVTLHIVGFAIVVGDMINGISKILIFFAVSALVAMIMLFWFTRCVRSTILVVTASLVAVVWQMGALPLLGFELTPYSVLVPFLVFAIGMSHGAQKMNGVMQDVGRGAHPLVAARHTFRRLFLAGFAALICDASSFAVLIMIHIAAIRELALLASLGVGILVFTNLIMLPIVLSYVGVSKSAAVRSLRNDSLDAGGRVDHPLWNFLDKFTTRNFAAGAICAAIVLGAAGIYVGRHVQVGDLNAGAPELRQNSTYNLDNSYIINHYATSSDSLVVMDDTPAQGCLSYATLSTLNNLEWQLDQMPQVQSATSLGSYIANLAMFLNEGSPKWYGIQNNQPFLNNLWEFVPRSMANFECDFDPLFVSLKDHKATTLTAVVTKIQGFINEPSHQSAQFRLSLVGGNAGIAAATNFVIQRASRVMLLLVYSTVICFCFIVFRSWRAVLCAVLPLCLTSVLAQALMVWLGIGIKVATLPVMALGVGIGVDYALYVLSIVMKHMRNGASLSQAYHRTLLFTGKVVLLTGFTLAVGVITWAFAPIKFQADMGLLLSFMFLWNMLGAMVLLPSLAYFLLPERIFVHKISVMTSRGVWGLKEMSIPTFHIRRK